MKKRNHNILDYLKEQFLILDGAMGNMLQISGLKFGVCPEEWNISHPDVIKKIHVDYLKAGADVILTNTFGVNCIKLKQFNLQDKVEAINQRAVDLAREALAIYQKNNSSIILLLARLARPGKF